MVIWMASLAREDFHMPDTLKGPKSVRTMYGGVQSKEVSYIIDINGS